jgi:multimeric flavodoxin WrbA
MKVVAFNGSPRPDGNTGYLIRHVNKVLESEGIETEIVQLGGNTIRGCKACYACFQTKNGRCVQTDDMVNDCIRKMQEADGIILASPTYVSGITPELTALIDRACLVVGVTQGLKRKVGAAVVAVRRGGEIHAFDTINHFFLITQMIVPGSSYWNMGFGREKGEVEKDEEGIRTMTVLGENMAWLLKRM